MFFENVKPLETALVDGTFPTLETFDSPFSSDQAGIIRIVFPEFTCVCPKTGYPDFATVTLLYLPDTKCLELKSWKLYLNSFRMVGTFHETVTSHLYKTIADLLRPRWALIVGDFLPRGNVDTTVIIETPTPRPASAAILIGSIASRCKTL